MHNNKPIKNHDQGFLYVRKKDLDNAITYGLFNNANEKEELFLSRNRAAIIDKYEKETQGKKWAEFSNPLLNTVRKAGGFSREDLDGLTVKEAINKLAKQKELESSKYGDEAKEEYSRVGYPNS